MSLPIGLQIVNLLTIHIGPSTYRVPHRPIILIVKVEAECSSEMPVTHVHDVTNQYSPCLFIFVYWHLF